MIDAKTLTDEQYVAKYNEQHTEPVTAVTPSAYEAMYHAERAKADQLREVLAAARINPDKPAAKDAGGPVKSADQVRAQLGQVQLLNMTREAKLATLGIVDASVTNQLLRGLFGRGNTGQLAKDLMLVSPTRYALLKQASLLLGIYGN